MKLFINSKNYYNQILDEWLNNKKNKVKKSTYLKYLTIIETLIKPKLGNYNFKTMTDKNIYDFFNSKKILELSTSTKKITLIIIKSSINYGIYKKYRATFNKIELKFKKNQNKIKYFSEKEQLILNDYLINNINLRNLGILISLYTGIRIGELCGLKWSDMDIMNSTLSIKRTVQRIKNLENDNSSKTKLIVGVPKTEYSVRTIPLPDFLISLLKKFKSADENYIFSNSLKPKDPRAYEKYFSCVLKKCEIKNLNFHALRHTFATRAREAGMDIKVLSEILGHSSYHITQDIYVHISSEFKKKSMDYLAKYLINRKFEEQI